MRLYFNQITPNIVSKASVNNNVTISCGAKIGGHLTPA